MAKSGISFKFDTKKFERNMKKELQKMVNKTPVEIACPNCESKFKISKGLNNCPNCQMVLDYNTKL